jgi:hypothetical protein
MGEVSDACSAAEKSNDKKEFGGVSYEMEQE